MKHIVLTGGGTAGHVTPNIALIPKLRELGYDIQYIGSYNGIEKELIEPFGIPYHGISSGKLRRYFSLQNFTDPFRVIKGFGEARKLIKGLKPDVIFSKGGFVSVPVVLAGKRCKVPVIIHESDMTPGLANKLAIPSAVKVCCNFPETLDALPEGKAVLTGSPIRQELLTGDKDAARKMCGFTDEKPVILVIGGSLGAASVNENIRKILPELLNQMTNSTTDDAILDADGANHGADNMESRLLSGLKQNPYITQTDLAKELSLSRRTVQRIMKELMNDGKIKRVGSTRTGHWEIND